MIPATQPAPRRIASAATIAKRIGVRIEVAREIRAAYLAGSASTELRRFIDEDERLGARRCCRSTGIKRLRRCPKPSTHVRYFVVLSGRLAYCERHAALEVSQ